MSRRMLFPFLAMLVLLPLDIQAQESGQIVGRAVDRDTGAPLGEVQVYLAGLGLGGLTRQNGAFLILEAPPGTHEIRAERIGLESASQQVTVVSGESVEVEFRLGSQALGLDEIIVTGTAGAARRREIGNSITQINTTDIPNRPQQVTDLLKGAGPGVTVSGIGGELGQGSQIRLRGNGSVSMSNQPIIYIDGVRMQSTLFPVVAAPDGPRSAWDTPSPLNSINPADIERMEIIKGSAATTLYGTEASARVIQIFTKRGSQGAPVWTAEIKEGLRWSRKFGGDERPYFLMDPWIRHGLVQDYSLSVRGGGQALQYFASGQFVDEEGVLVDDYGKTWSMRGNFTFTPAANIQIQWNTAFVHRWQDNMAGANNAHGVSLNAMRGDANYVGGYDVEAINQLREYDIKSVQERFTTGATVTYSPLANLNNRLTIGYDVTQRVVDNLRPFGFVLRPEGALFITDFQHRLLTLDYAGTLNFGLTSAIRSNLSWGGQIVGDNIRTFVGWATDFPGAKAPTLSSASVSVADESEEKIWNAGFFLQNVFDVSDRYFITLGMRVDGNSAFGQDFGLQLYPKVSGSWVVSEEDFWQPGWGQVKLRAAYGQSGRAPGAFDAVRTWEAAGWAGQSAFRPLNVGNPSLGPEVTGEFEFGFDASWLNDRLSAQFTYYNQTTSDALFEVVQIPSDGFREAQLRNAGEISNTGIELGVNTTPIAGTRWRWDVGVDLTTNKSTVTSLGGNPAFSLGGGAYIAEGQPAPVMRGNYVINPDEAAAPVFEADHNYGPNVPTHSVGLNTAVEFPFGLRLAARGEYQGGFYRMINPGQNSVGRSIRFPACFPYYEVPEPTIGNPSAGIALKADTPALWRARCTPSLRDQGTWTFPGDFFRLRSVTATVPVDFLFPQSITNASLALSLNESFTWLKDFPVYDPEMSGQDGNDQVFGVTDRIPTPISFQLSLRINF